MGTFIVDMRVIVFVAILAAAPCQATDVSLLDPGDVIYRTGFLGVVSAEKVLVVRVDLDGKKAKVRNIESGVTEWVDSSELYTEDELSRARWLLAGKTAIAAADGIAKAQIGKVDRSCMSDEGMKFALALALTMKGKPDAPINPICTCFAEKIVKNESSQTIDRIAVNFDNTKELGEAKFERYLKACVPK